MQPVTVIVASERNGGIILPAFPLLVCYLLLPLFLCLLPLFLCTSLIGAYLPAQAQPSRQAVQVVNARTDRPIAYASVDVCSQPLGTVADATGTLPLM